MSSARQPSLLEGARSVDVFAGEAARGYAVDEELMESSVLKSECDARSPVRS